MVYLVRTWNRDIIPLDKPLHCNLVTGSICIGNDFDNMKTIVSYGEDNPKKALNCYEYIIGCISKGCKAIYIFDPEKE